MNGLPTAAELQAALDAITDLQSDLAALGTLPTDAGITALQNQINAINAQLGPLVTQVNGIAQDVAGLCGLTVLGVPLGTAC